MIPDNITFLGIARTQRELVAVFRNERNKLVFASAQDELISSYLLKGSSGNKIADRFRPLLMLEMAQQAVMQGKLLVGRIPLVPDGERREVSADDPYAVLKHTFDRHGMNPLYRGRTPAFLASGEGKAAAQQLREALRDEMHRQGPMEVRLYRPERTASAPQPKRGILPWIKSCATLVLRS